MFNLPPELRLTAAAFIIAAALRFLQKRFPKKDPLFIERFIIAASAGLLLLITANKLLGIPALAPLSIPFAAAIFVVSVFHRGYGGKLSELPPLRRAALFSASVTVVAFVSYLTLGLPGLVVLVPAWFLFPRSSIR